MWSEYIYILLHIWGWKIRVPNKITWLLWNSVLCQSFNTVKWKLKVKGVWHVLCFLCFCFFASSSKFPNNFLNSQLFYLNLHNFFWPGWSLQLHSNTAEWHPPPPHTYRLGRISQPHLCIMLSIIGWFCPCTHYYCKIRQTALYIKHSAGLLSKCYAAKDICYTEHKKWSDVLHTSSALQVQGVQNY